MTIGYDYVLERDEGDKKVIYKPDKIPKILPSIALINGPNSSGKSTLLNLIALGFYGEKNDRLVPLLKEKIQNMNYSDYQKVKFEINIYDKDHNLILKSEKKDFNSDIEVYGQYNGSMKRISADRFFIEYNLIYDIPENPMGRLKDLTTEVEKFQSRYIGWIETLENYITRVIEDINRSRNPEKIKELKTKIEYLEEERKRRVNIKDETEKITKNLSRYVYTRLATEYKSRLDEADKKLNKFQKELKNITKDVSDARKKANKIKEEIDEVEKIHEDLTVLLHRYLPLDEHYRINIWESMSLKKHKIDSEEEMNRFETQILELENIFKNMWNKLKESDLAKKTEIFERLIGILSEFEDDDIEIPGINKSIKEFLQILRWEAENNIEKSKEESNKFKDIEEICELLDDLDKKINVIKTSVNNIIDISRDIPYDYDDAEKHEKQLKDEKEKCKAKYEEYKASCISLHIPENEIEQELRKIEPDFPEMIGLDKDGLISKHNDMMRSEKEAEKSVDEIESALKIRKRDLKDLEESKPHKYQNYKDELNILFKNCQTLRSRLARYNNYLRDLMQGKPQRLVDKDIDKYYKNLSIYLGKRMGKIRHIDGEYTVKEVDLANRLISTNEGKKIRFDDMGTGQSQAAYLKSILNTNDDRKMIVLIDEVAMIDNTTLKSIVDLMRNLYQEGKMIIGIVVQIAQEGGVKVKDPLEG